MECAVERGHRAVVAALGETGSRPEGDWLRDQVTNPPPPLHRSRPNKMVTTPPAYAHVGGHVTGARAEMRWAGDRACRCVCVCV